MKNDKSLDSILASFEIADLETADREGSKPITIWVPTKVQQKYESLQEKSRRKFGKKLKEVVINSIDKVFESEAS